MSKDVTKFRFLVIFDSCDVMYNWSISLVPPIVLNNLYVHNCSLPFSECNFPRLKLLGFSAT